MPTCWTEGLKPALEIAEALERVGHHSISITPESQDIYELKTNDSARKPDKINRI